MATSVFKPALAVLPFAVALLGHPSSAADLDVISQGGFRCSTRAADYVYPIRRGGAGGGTTSRIKDLANVEGVRQNQLIGYGLVVGLNGTGDTINNSPFTRQSLQAMLERSGQHPRPDAAHRQRRGRDGDRQPAGFRDPRHAPRRLGIGARRRQEPAGRHAAGDPLLGADGNVYAVAQGSLAIGGFEAEGQAAKVVRGVPTNGRIANGAIVEREIDFALNRLNQIRLALRNPDFTTAKRVAASINDFICTRQRNRSTPRPCMSPCRRNIKATSSRC